VVGLEDKLYGEAVSCFLRLASNVERRLADMNIKEWVVKSLGKSRMPQYIFWMGDDDVGSELPKNGSGKIQKHLVREMGNRLVGSRISRAKL
jgi:mevalonyl-CoA ligase